MAYLIWAWLAAHECGATCAAALLGNAQTEVGPELDPCTKGPYLGLFQWGGERRAALLKRYGRDWCRLQNQLTFALDELKAKGLWTALTHTKSAAEAAAIVNVFEDGIKLRQRQDLAHSYLKEIKRMTDTAIQWRWAGK